MIVNNEEMQNIKHDLSQKILKEVDEKLLNLQDFKNKDSYILYNDDDSPLLSAINLPFD